MEILKKIWIISLCLQIGLSNSVLQEIFSFPSLMEHYWQHSQEQSIGFIEFIRLHYTESEHQNQHLPNHNHGSLPFHHPVNNLQISAFTIPDNIQIRFEKIYVNPKKVLCSNAFILKDSLISTFWHPPKLA